MAHTHIFYPHPPPQAQPHLPPPPAAPSSAPAAPFLCHSAPHHGRRQDWSRGRAAAPSCTGAAAGKSTPMRRGGHDGDAWGAGEHDGRRDEVTASSRRKLQRRLAGSRRRRARSSPVSSTRRRPAPSSLRRRPQCQGARGELKVAAASCPPRPRLLRLSTSSATPPSRRRRPLFCSPSLMAGAPRARRGEIRLRGGAGAPASEHGHGGTGVAAVAQELRLPTTGATARGRWG
jgi:hypothetical protein